MAWTAIPSKNPGDPVRAIDYNATNENITAVPEGASGAPRIVRAAMALPIAGTTYLQKWIGDWSTTATGGFPDAQLTRDLGDNIRLCTALQSGSVTVRYTFDVTGSALDGYLRILKNGVVQHSYAGSSTITNTPTILVAAGDTLHMQVYTGGGTLELTDISIRTANNVIAVA